jgi:hypothetical protein
LNSRRRSRLAWLQVEWRAATTSSNKIEANTARPEIRDPALRARVPKLPASGLARR